MLALKPTCENCNRSLPPASAEAMICSYECTFCRDCVATVLANVCPNCGGGFWQRPVRPRKKLDTHPASTTEHFRPVDRAAHREFAKAIKDIPASDR